MSRPKLRALVLAAGQGSRLRPLTHFLPKPLLPICGEPVAGHTLRQLARIDCEAAVLNLHHLADQIPQFFGRSYHGLPLQYSREEELQGTLGALFAPRRFLVAADLILLINGDTLCRWPVQRMIRRHLQSGAVATLLVHRRPPEEAHGGGVGVGAKGRIVSLRGSEPRGEERHRHLFAGLHILSPSLLQRVEDRPGDIIDGLYLPLLAEGAHLQAVVTRRRWHDLGTPSRYFAAVREIASAPLGSVPLGRASKHGHLSPLAEISASANVKNAVIEARASIAEKVKIESSIILPDAKVLANCEIRDSILGPGVRLPAATNVERRMINRLPEVYQPGPHDTVMGDLVYTPL